MYTIAHFDTKDFYTLSKGNVHHRNFAGESVRRYKGGNQANFTWKYERATTKATGTYKVAKWRTPNTNKSVAPLKKDTEYTVVTMDNHGNYPFVPFSPNIDYILGLFMTADKAKKELTIIGVMKHDNFPDYEAIIDGKAVVKYKTNDTGPTNSNLTRETYDTFRLTVKM